MRAVVVDEFGGPEVLRLRDVPDPVPGPGQVAIDVAYVGLNFADVMGRANGYLVPSLPFVPGLEASGRVRATGEGVDGLAVGQPVTTMTLSGGYADVVVVPSALAFALPDAIDRRTAAALPIVLPTAHALVHESGRLLTGETVLVHGAAGGVGTVAGQIASGAGAAAVYGVVSTPEKAAYALGFGYDEVFLAACGSDLNEAVENVRVGTTVTLTVALASAQ